jgi:hypothetical protein
LGIVEQVQLGLVRAKNGVSTQVDFAGFRVRDNCGPDAYFGLEPATGKH